MELKADLNRPGVKDMFFQRQHHLDVYIAGTQNVIDQKRGEIHTLNGKLEE